MWGVCLCLLYCPVKLVNGESLVHPVQKFYVQFVVPLLLVEYMLSFEFLLSALTFLLPDDLCQKVGDVVWLKLADYDVEWKHLYVVSFTIDIMNYYARKLLSIGMPLSHPLCFPDLPLDATLQQSRSCTERPMSMKFFSMRLTPTLTKYLH